ncbi:hypothetical protein D9M73_246030 [compost metagenome]
MLDALQALGNHLAPKGPGQTDHRPGQRQIVMVMEDVAHEGLVDLDGAGRQALEVAQRRVAGAEIVQRETHAQLLAGVQALTDPLDVLDRYRLDDFQIEHLRCHARMTRQQVL